MRKVTIIITFFLVFGTPIAHAKEVPTELQLQQLFESVSRVVPEKVRVISLYATEAAPPSEDEIKRRLDRIRKMNEKMQEGVPEPVRTQRIEEAVQLNRSVMTGKAYRKCQEWKSGPLYRQDRTIGWRSLEEADLKTNYNTTFINLDKNNGAISTVIINHDTKSFEKNSNEESKWAEVGAWNATTVEPRVAVVVGAALASKESIRRKAQDENQKLAIDQDKLQQVLSGRHPLFKVYLDEKVLEGQQLCNFEFNVQDGAATVIIECHKTNYNRITRTELRNKKGEIALSSVRKKFDSQDFPHEYLLTESKKNGYTTKTFFIKEVELNAGFSDDEVFRFAPPKNYGVVDMTGGKPKIESFPGGIKPSRIIDINDTHKAHSALRKRVFISLFAVISIFPLVYVIWKSVKKSS